jgi:ubiquinone/menaquinone biosynthesis C-methylase UbiE|tara:strand:- start:374 stop:970 length:597 start_codon:yes stop_codon:yes gene_type:complete
MYNTYSGFFKRQRDKYFHNILDRHFKKIPSILDIGCGQGDFLIQAKQLNLNAYGIDDKDHWVEYCTKRGLKATKASIYEIPFDNQSVDGIFIQSVLEHVDASKAMYELTRILKKDGIIAISCPTPEKHFWDDPTHVRPHTIKSLSTLMEMFNLEVIYKNYVFAELLGINISWNGLFKLLNLVPARIGSNIIVIGKKNN